MASAFSAMKASRSLLRNSSSSARSQTAETFILRAFARFTRSARSVTFVRTFRTAFIYTLYMRMLARATDLGVWSRGHGEPHRGSEVGTREKTIAKGELRLGVEVANQFSDSTVQWHHLACAASKLPAELKEAMAGY